MLTPEQAARAKTLSPAEKAKLVTLLHEKRRREKRKRFEHLFPDAHHEWMGEQFHAREGYRKHLEFFDATARFPEVCFRAGNRVGKTETGAYALSVWLTGRYPHWWTGRRFSGPIEAWAAGRTNETTRDVIQHKLLGPIIGSHANKRPSGEGILPGDALGQPTWKSGVSNLVDVIPIKHVSGGTSWLGLKAYEQGRGSFEGTAKHVVWFDEEPPLDVYSEALVRLMTLRGILMLTYTPLEGETDTTLLFKGEDE